MSGRHLTDFVAGAGDFAAFDETAPPPAMPDCRFGASAAMPPGATSAAPDRPWHGGHLPRPAAARTIAASTATTMPLPGRPGRRSAICDPSGARSAAAALPFDLSC